MKIPSAEVEEVAQAGIRGMISAIDAEKCSADLMIDAALHILAAWVAVEPNKILGHTAHRRRRGAG